MDALGIASMVIQTLTLLFAALAVAVAYREARLIRSELHIAQTTAWAEFLLRLDQRFLEHPLRDVASQIEAGVLKVNDNNRWDVINYLATFELLYEFEMKGLLDREVITRYYSDSIIAAGDNEEIRKKILGDKQSSIDWSRFNTLYAEMIESKKRRRL